jgi:hypothetical protein
MNSDLIVYDFSPEKGQCLLFDRENRYLYVIDVAAVRTCDISELPRRPRTTKEKQWKSRPKEDQMPVEKAKELLINNEEFLAIRDPRTMFDD